MRQHSFSCVSERTMIRLLFRFREVTERRLEMRITIGAALLILSLTATVISQQTQQLGQSDRAAAARVKALSDRLQFRDDDDADKARYYAEFDSIRDRIRSEVDDFVRIGIDPDATTQRTEERLRAVLADHKPNPD